MGLDRSQKHDFFHVIRSACLPPVNGAALCVLRRIEEFLSNHQTGNKSGAPKLTIPG
jgi:hypothetical protein